MTDKIARDAQVPTRRGLMQIETLAVDETGHIRFQAMHEVDAVALMVMAETREELARSKGRAFTEGAIPFFGAELIEAARGGKRKDDIHKAAVDVALAAWLVDSLYEAL